MADVGVSLSGQLAEAANRDFEWQVDRHEEHHSPRSRSRAGAAAPVKQRSSEVHSGPLHHLERLWWIGSRHVGLQRDILQPADEHLLPPQHQRCQIIVTAIVYQKPLAFPMPNNWRPG